MTFEQRMAELGVDLSDLPTRYEVEHRSAAFDAADNFGGSLSMTHNFTAYILHLTDVIDRMETRLVNLTGELNYIKQTFMDCATCTEGSVIHSDKCNSCDENYSNYEFAGVLEGWSVDE